MGSQVKMMKIKTEVLKILCSAISKRQETGRLLVEYTTISFTYPPKIETTEPNLEGAVVQKIPSAIASTRLVDTTYDWLIRQQLSPAGV